MPDRVAFIGLGIMGQPMAGHLLRAGYLLSVHTRSRSKADELIEAGATWAASPADAARDADFIFICVPDTPDVEKVILADDGVIATVKRGAIVIDHSTISPTATRDMSAKLAERGALMLDAPISGGDIGARNATLSIMCGGDQSAFDTALPLLQTLGKTITYCGQSGNGQATKLVNQILVLGTLMAVCEALQFASAAALDLPTTLHAVGAGAGKSWQLEQLGAKIAIGDFAPGFMIDLAQKDLRLIQDFAAQTGSPVPTAQQVHELYKRVQAMGMGRSGTQALFHAFARL